MGTLKETAISSKKTSEEEEANFPEFYVLIRNHSKLTNNCTAYRTASG